MFMVFHHMMHVLTLQHQGCVATLNILGGMPTPEVPTCERKSSLTMVGLQ